MYAKSKIAKRVKSIPLLTVPMTEENESIVDIPKGQKDFLCIMDYTNIDKSWLPQNFNGMEVWKDLLTPTQDQQECGACWAFASSSCLADRFNILSNHKIIPSVSTNFSLLCAFNEDLVISKVLETQIKGNDYRSDQQLMEAINRLNALQFQCGGNYLISAWCALYANGTTTDDCLPYKLIDPFIQQYQLLDFGFNGRTAFLDTTSSDKVRSQNFFFLLDKANATWSCSRIVGANRELCWSHTIMNNQMYGIPLKHFYCGLIYQVKDSKDLDAAIRYDIFKYGPVSTVMNVFDDFFDFDPINDGVYAPRQDPSLSAGGHAVEIVGWGVYNNIPFWWIRNSWSSEWGINNGCFRMERGNKSCEIEANVITGIPNFLFTPDQYDQFLDEFPRHNPIVIKSPYYDCLGNPWMKKFFQIYYSPIIIDLYQSPPTKRLTYFRILAQHPGQKAVLYPEYGLTTKIMSVYPGVLQEPFPNPSEILKWLWSGKYAGKNLLQVKKEKGVRSKLFVWWWILFLSLLFFWALVVWVRRRRRSSTDL